MDDIGKRSDIAREPALLPEGPGPAGRVTTGQDELEIQGAPYHEPVSGA